MSRTSIQSAPAVHRRFNKVPEVTSFFWAIKIMATTVGETGADYLIFKMHLGCR